MIIDFKENWYIVKPILPTIQDALEFGLIRWCHTTNQDYRDSNFPWLYSLHALAGYPKPESDTVEVFQCFGACDFLLEWHMALAESLFPDWDWFCFSGAGNDSHSFVIGFKDDQHMIFDILSYDLTEQEILAWTGFDLDSVLRERRLAKTFARASQI